MGVRGKGCYVVNWKKMTLMQHWELVKTIMDITPYFLDS
jgi:hypothetical protein